MVLNSLWRAVAGQTVGARPGRVEPRQVKRGPKAYTKLRMPRRQAVAELLRVWEQELAAESAREIGRASCRERVLWYV